MRRLLDAMGFVRLWLPLAFAFAQVAAQGENASIARPPGPAQPAAKAPALVGNGVADDTEALQGMVDARASGVRLAPGTYRITRPIVIELDRVGPTSIVGDGTARLVMAGPGPALRFLGTHEGTADPGSVQPNVWQRQRMPCVDGLEIVGAHEEAVGIEAAGTMQLVITRTNIRHVLHAVHLIRRNRNVILAACHLYENRGAGVYLDDVNLHQINITGCHISYNAAGGVVARAGNVRNIQIAGCDIEANMAADGPPTANVLIDGTAGEYATAEVAITGSTIQHTAKAPGSANIRFLGADRLNRPWGNLTIADNVLSDVKINVEIRGARGVSITGNTFWGAEDHDLLVEQSAHVVVGPNMFDHNPGYDREGLYSGGIVFRDCQDCTLSGVHLNGAPRAEAGIVLRRCRRINVTGCTLLDCPQAGLLLDQVTASRVSACLIRNDLPDTGPWQPIRLLSSQDNRIEP